MLDIIFGSKFFGFIPITLGILLWRYMRKKYLEKWVPGEPVKGGDIYSFLNGWSLVIFLILGGLMSIYVSFFR